MSRVYFVGHDVAITIGVVGARAAIRAQTV